MISGTITDASGRTFRIKTAAFGIRGVMPGRSLLALTARWAPSSCGPTLKSCQHCRDVYLCVPECGPAPAFGEYDEHACETADYIREFAESGFVNVVGGCCSARRIIFTICDAVTKIAPRKLSSVEVKCRFGGLEAFNIASNSLFVNVGERTNVTGSAKFRKLIGG
jgi:5-methyltetrahydrofolate--homocysteine methyltransferase